MYDYTNVAKGGVYEILDSMGNLTGKMYMVVSNDQFNTMGSNVYMVMIDVPMTSTKADVYHVPFDIISNGVATPMEIYPEMLMAVNKRKLAKFKFTLSRDIQKQVDKKLFQIFTGDVMFSLDEAIVELHNIEMNKRVEIMTSMKVTEPEVMQSDVEDTGPDDIDYDDTEMDTEDAQRLFAMKMKKEPQPEITKQVQEVIDKVNSVVEEPPKKKRGGYTTDNPGKVNPAYAHVYDQKEDYLLDYYSMSNSDVAKKWNLQDARSVRNRATACRLMLIREGVDMSYFEQLSKEHKSDTMSKRYKKNKTK